MNELIVNIIVGLLLSLSAGVRMTLPLLGMCLLAQLNIVHLPENMDWLASDASLIILVIAAIAETVIHFIPAAGTALKAAVTPLAFMAGTLLMAVPLEGHNPLHQWAFAAVVGGSSAALMHLSVVGSRVIAAPANMASLGILSIVWNAGEMLFSIALAVLAMICSVEGWVIGAVSLFAIGTFMLIVLTKIMLARHERET